jgi:hypothetical protein
MGTLGHKPSESQRMTAGKRRFGALAQVTPRVQIPPPPPNVFVGWLTVNRRGPTFCDLRYLAAISS